MGLDRDSFGTHDHRLETRSLTVVCQALGSLEAAVEIAPTRHWWNPAEFVSDPLDVSLPSGLHELAEQRPSVVWTGCRLRMVLHAKDRQLPVLQPLDRFVVEVHMR